MVSTLHTPPIAPALPGASKTPPAPLPYPPAVAVALYSAEDLRERFVFLRRDYCRIIAGTNHLPNKERFALVRQRLAEYSDALADALGDAADDAAILMRDQRSRHGGW
jgi:hypothetical protein